LAETEFNSRQCIGQRCAIRPATNTLLHPNLAEIYRGKVADLQAALAEPATQTEALEMLRGLIERVVLHPAETGFEIELTSGIEPCRPAQPGGKVDMATQPASRDFLRELPISQHNRLLYSGQQPQNDPINGPFAARSCMATKLEASTREADHPVDVG
jgi:hypothetical protein